MNPLAGGQAVNGDEAMASFESGDAPRTSGWRDLLMSLAAGLLLSGCLSSLPDVAQMLKEVSFGKPASSDENLVN